MKKTLILASLLAFTMSTAMANDRPCPISVDDKRPPIEHGKYPPPPPFKNMKKMEAKKAEFDKKLNLTDEQKAQAKEIRMKGHEEMKPIMDKLKNKKLEADKIMQSDLCAEEKEQKLALIKEDIKNIKKEIRDLRAKNMKEFEAILTDDQKKTIEKMKKEGRKNFKKHHPKRPPCQPKCKCKCNKK